MPSDPTSFPLREGGSVPRELILMHEATLVRCHGVSLINLAARGGISVYEVLLLQPPPAGINKTTYTNNICDLTVSGAQQALDGVLAAFHAKKEADAEAAMLAMMEEGAPAEGV
jgi:hypothetical protein